MYLVPYGAGYASLPQFVHNVRNVADDNNSKWSWKTHDHSYNRAIKIQIYGEWWDLRGTIYTHAAVVGSTTTMEPGRHQVGIIAICTNLMREGEAPSRRSTGTAGALTSGTRLLLARGRAVCMFFLCVSFICCN